MIKNFPLYDAHCHIYPHKILPRAVLATGDFYLEKPYHDGTVEQLISAGEKAGIDRFIVQSVATTPHQVKSINEFIADEVNKRSDKLIGLGTIHPESEDMRADIMHLKNLGLHGIKIHPDIQHFAVDCKGFEEAYDICEELGLPVLMHTGDKRYDFSNPNRLSPLLKRRPGLIVIGAHLGGWSLWETAVRYLYDFENLYVDTSSALCYIEKEKALEVIRTYGADRVLFGTDYPLHNLTNEVKIFEDLPLDNDEREKISYLNAKKVYGI
ncbi:MAG: amidohydrolase [Clostridia bacterium]|nr:amidohydrolase [Clostridia bacterium]